MITVCRTARLSVEMGNLWIVDETGGASCLAELDLFL